ncbi:MAG: hypothetical protein KGO01_05630 [Burkholderiales bacterium]|nr:hypothetical protein [Burkholderiales bacterium]
MALKMYDYAKGVSPMGCVKLSDMGAPVRDFVTALIAEEAWCADYFNHSDKRDPNTGGGKCGVGVSVKIYYAPCTDKEYKAYDVLSIKNDAIWASGKRRVALREEGGVHKVYMANHTGKSTADVRDSSTYRYSEIDVSR